jgi:hypothetical protein
MRIANQPIVETEDYIQIRIHDPYWSAWKRFGWAKNVEGFGLSNKLIKYAFKKNKHIRVSNKYGKYEIPPVRACREAKKHDSRYEARNGTELLVVPRTAFKRIPKKEDTAKDKKKEQTRNESIRQATLQFNF